MPKHDDSEMIDPLTMLSMFVRSGMNEPMIPTTSPSAIKYIEIFVRLVSWGFTITSASFGVNKNHVIPPPTSSKTKTSKIMAYVVSLGIMPL